MEYNELSRGAIHHISTRNATDLKPILQVYNIKCMQQAGGDSRPASVRYRFSLTDGVESIMAMSSTQVTAAFREGAVKENTVILLKNYQINNIQDAKALILIVLELEIRGQGQPQALAGKTPVATAAQPPAVQKTTYVPGHPPSHVPPAQQTAPVGMGIAPPTYGQQQSYHAPHSAHPQVNQTVPSYAPHPTPAPPSFHTSGMAQNAPAAPYGAPASAYPPRGGPVAREDSATGPIVPISAINPYSSKWTIKARVTAKSEMKHWSNARGEGTLFSIDLLDSQGGEIRGTFFKEACAKFFPQIAEGQVYTFSGGTLKVVQNRQYSNIKNPYEITFNQNSEIRPAANDVAIKSQTFSFVKLNAVGSAEVGSTIDLIAVVRQASEPTEIISQKMGGKTLKKRDLQLVDETGFEIRFTWWGEKAMQDYNWNTQPIVAIKGAKIGDYGGRSLSSLNSTSILFEPTTVGPEYHALALWKSQFGQGVQAGTSFSNGGAGGASGNESFDKRKTIAAIRDENLGMQEKPDYIVLKGTVVYIKHDNDPWYTACPNESCNKKVTESMNGQWFCEKCGQNFNKCNRRYILSLNMSDHTGSGWFSLFNETAEKLLGCSAEQLHEYRQDASLQQEYEKVFSNALFKTVVVKCRVKQEPMNEELRVKSSVIRVDDLDFASECKNMLEAINKYQ